MKHYTQHNQIQTSPLFIHIHIQKQDTEMTPTMKPKLYNNICSLKGWVSDSDPLYFPVKFSECLLTEECVLKTQVWCL